MRSLSYVRMWLFLGSASISYVGAQYVPALWPVTFLFPIFFIWALLTDTPTTRDAITWGLLTWGPYHLAAVGLGTARAAQFHWVWCLLFVFGITLSCALVLAGFLRLFIYMQSRMARSSDDTLSTVAVATATLFMTIIVQQHFLLVPIGRWEGSHFLNPTILLSEFPPLIMPVAFIGLDGLTFLFILFCSTIVFCIIKPRLCHFIPPFTLAGLWYLLASSAPLPQAPAGLTKPIGFVREQFIIRAETSFLMQKICDGIIAETRTIGPLDFVVFPETAVWGDWHRKPPQTTLPILIGGERKTTDKLFNTAFYLDHHLERPYSVDKRHLVPITETCYYHPGELHFPRWELSTGPCVLPLICSEILYDHLWRYIAPGTFVVALSNDSFAPRWAVRLFARFARIQAIQYQCPILFAARQFMEAIWFTKDRTLVLSSDVIVEIDIKKYVQQAGMTKRR